MSGPVWDKYHAIFEGPASSAFDISWIGPSLLNENFRLQKRHTYQSENITLFTKTKSFGMFNKISVGYISIDNSLKSRLPGLLKYCDTSRISEYTLMNCSYPRTILTRFALVDVMKSLSNEEVVHMIDSNMQLIRLCPGDIINRMRQVPVSQKSIFIIAACIVVIGNPMIISTDDFYMQIPVMEQLVNILYGMTTLPGTQIDIREYCSIFVERVQQLSVSEMIRYQEQFSAL